MNFKVLVAPLTDLKIGTVAYISFNASLVKFGKLLNSIV